jgi:hypothetical protein
MMSTLAKNSTSSPPGLQVILNVFPVTVIATDHPCDTNDCPGDPIGAIATPPTIVEIEPLVVFIAKVAISLANFPNPVVPALILISIVE